MKFWLKSIKIPYIVDAISISAHLDRFKIIGELFKLIVIHLIFRGVQFQSHSFLEDLSLQLWVLSEN